MKFKVLLSIAAVILSLSSQAGATPITVTGFQYKGTPTTVQIKNAIPYENANVYSGGFATTDGSSSFLSWCVDIFQNTYFNQTSTYYSLTSGLSALGASKADALGRLATEALGMVNNAATSGAFQLAVWEIVNETTGNPYNLKSGNFKASKASNGSLTLAQTWLNNLPVTSSFSVSVWQSPTKQDLAVFKPATVPEPGTIAMLGLGLFGISFASMRNKNKTRA